MRPRSAWWRRGPALGFGWGTFGQASIPYYRLGQDLPPDEPSATPTTSRCRTPPSSGCWASRLWVAILIAAIAIPAVRRGPPDIEPYRLGLIAIATAWFVQSNFTPFDYAFDNYVVWLLAGVVAAASYQSRPVASDDVRRPVPPDDVRVDREAAPRATAFFVV